MNTPYNSYLCDDSYGMDMLYAEAAALETTADTNL